MILVELNYVEIGNRIAQRRIHAGIKQTNLAETVGISNNYLSSIERGKERPSLEILVSICNALHVTPDYLLMGNMHSNNIPQNITDGLRLGVAFIKAAGLDAEIDQLIIDSSAVQVFDGMGGAAVDLRQKEHLFFRCFRSRGKGGRCR